MPTHNTYPFDEKLVLVTRGGTGIGQAIARSLPRRRRERRGRGPVPRQVRRLPRKYVADLDHDDRDDLRRTNIDAFVRS